MGLFLSMEGPDGSGKSLQLDLLEKQLKKLGYKVLRSREPGGTVIGERIRDILLDPGSSAMNPITEALLYAASRSQHVSEVIKPALGNGYIVLADRFIDSSLVYQGIGRGLGLENVEMVNRWAIQGTIPDLTLIVYIDYEEGLRRKQLQQGHRLDRLEQEKEDFHRRVSQGYLELARRYPDRIALIDGSKSIPDVQKAIWKRVEPLLQSREEQP